MNISPLYKILVYIEDKRSASLSDLGFVGANQVRGILGKMEAMKLIDRNDGQFRLSEKGQEFLNTILDVLHQPTQHWDQKWRFVSFSIAEKNRSKRDKFRRELEGLGLKHYLNSFWISPFDLTGRVNRIAEKLDIKKDVLIIEADKIEGRTSEELASAWNFDSSRKQFEEFITFSEELIHDKTKEKYDAKLGIFQYALILNSQPKLPIELMPKDWPQFRANLQYRKLKRLVTK